MVTKVFTLIAILFNTIFLIIAYTSTQPIIDAGTDNNPTDGDDNGGSDGGGHHGGDDGDDGGHCGGGDGDVHHGGDGNDGGGHVVVISIVFIMVMVAELQWDFFFPFSILKYMILHGDWEAAPKHLRCLGFAG